jgi:hypothetical protein
MTGLSILGSPAFNGEQATIEVDANPPHLEHLTAPDATLVQTSGLPRLKALNRDSSERLGVPRSKKPM